MAKSPMVRIHHPELGVDVDVPARSVPSWKLVGWKTVSKTAAKKADAEKAAEAD